MFVIKDVISEFEGVRLGGTDERGTRDSVLITEEAWGHLIDMITEELELRQEPPITPTETQYLEQLAAEGILPEDL